MLGHHPTRRGVLLGLGAVAAWSLMPRPGLAAAGRDPRYLTIIMRGALDSLAAVAPTFDPDYQRIRAGSLIGEDGNLAGLPLGSGYVLNPHLSTFHELYKGGQALVVHAVASPYRDRSHFDGQDVLESGMPGVGRVRNGWLNRAIATLPAGGRVHAEGLGIGATVPLIMMGEAPVATWMPTVGASASEDIRMRLLDLYERTDQRLADALRQSAYIDGISGGIMPRGPARNDFLVGMEAVGRLFAAPNGPRVGSIDLNGFDTHVNQGPVTGQLGARLGELDSGLKTLRDGLGEAWKDTVVTVITEFGRTAHMNGNLGTDHGTATLAFVVGGAVRGGRVIADWPGLAETRLYQGRDLMPTTDLRAVLKGTLHDHLGIGEQLLADRVFPQSAAVRPMADLVA
ncbi:DUF1501 domain-containing protein [Labrys wisconsinensis]|uniref:Uncharacterized protein (DUF1501 family) n=1 Tax=Labrys wisconsinensis TaxID=425677 RepID=A0ABU0JF10_9HYPH|nr:DUF1501 domain-containing protein [Labrys wisconsinensis]MDQ0472866.1 uncharacterized protein (DUF1501 family) [Labrys wisconsinensis]